MSQHDYVIDDATGLAFLADLNLAMGAIASNNSGNTAPATTRPFLMWCDTSGVEGGLLKIRNAADTAWTILGPLTGFNIQSGTQTTTIATGTVDAILIDFIPSVSVLYAGPKWWRATGKNTSITPTLKTGSTAVKTLVKGPNIALAPGDIPGAGAWMLSQYDATFDKEVLLNPAMGVTPVAGTSGGGTDSVFVENDVIATMSYTIGQNAMVPGAAISIASPAVITSPNTFIAGQPVRFTTTGALPTGLVSTGMYFVIAAGLSTASFQVSATAGGAALATSGTQSGVQSVGKIKNGVTGGPFTTADGVVIEIPTGSTWSIT